MMQPTAPAQATATAAARAGADTASPGLKHPYHLVDPSPWPLIGAVGAGLTVVGVILAAHYGDYIVLAAGLAVVLA